MRIETFSLKGMLRFRDPVTVDLRELPPGLIGIVGGNGEGKTALLESPIGAIFRELPSRSDRELMDYATERDSYVETTFAIDGQGRYRARVNLDGPKRTSDAILEQTLADGRTAVLTDGRVSTYDDYIRAHFPPKALVLASAFAAQNRRGSFVTLGKKERRDLFAQLLGLERYEAMAAVARTSVSLCEQAAVRLSALRDVLTRDSSPEIGADLDRLDMELDQRRRQADHRRAAVVTTITDVEMRLATMQDAVAAYAAATQRIGTLTNERATRLGERAGIETQRTRADRDHADEVKRLQDKLAADLRDLDTRRTRADAEYTDELKAIATKSNAALRDTDERIAGNRKIQAQGDEIRAAVKTIDDVDRALALYDKDIEQTQTAIATVSERGRQHERDAAKLDQAAAALERANLDASLLTSVPCGGTGDFASCQFLTNAQAARTSISDLEETLRARPLLDRVLSETAERLRLLEENLEDLRMHRTRVTAKKDAAMPLAKRAEALAAADARIQELTSTRASIVADDHAATSATTRRRDTAIAELDARRPQLEADTQTAIWKADERHDAAVADLTTRMADLEQRLTGLHAELTAAQADLAGLTDKHARVVALQVELTDARSSHDSLIRELATIEAHASDVQRRRDDYQQKQERVTKVSERLQLVNTEIVEWQRIAQALSREGLPTLEIDAAGPTVSSYANDLMNVAFGPRFTLELVTEQAKRDGKGTKEVFSIAVLDNARGGEARDIADLSGGEQVIVDEAIKNALGVYLNQRSPMPIRTCWRDETTGPLDAENAPRYIQMLRRVQELAGYHHVLFVSHNAECSAMADAQIQVADGQATVVLPPYTRAA
jgi:exonuclease SbcC